MPRLRLSCVACLVTATMVLQGIGIATGTEAKRTQRRSQPVPTARAAPDVTATVPAKAPAPAMDDETLPKPFDLPAAPRARVRACGEKWRDIKMSGTVGNQTWREFATKCLVQADEAKTRSP